MNQAQPSTTSNKDITGSNMNNDQLIIVEEKVTNALGEPVIKKYTRGKFLGKGGFAKCYEFIRRDNGEVFAAKVIPKASLKKRRAK
jgi:hypothetical protein